MVPGIVKHYEYLMVPYIIAENPAMDYKEAFQISKQMMDGEKWKHLSWICHSLDGIC